MKKSTAIYTFLLITLILFHSSCATIFNKKTERVKISTGKNVTIIAVEDARRRDTAVLGENSARYYRFYRSNQPVTITLQTDSVQKKIQLKPGKSFAYWANIYCNSGIGMLYDRRSVKHYAYAPSNHISIKDSNAGISHFAQMKKGNTVISLTLPFINAFDIHTDSSRSRSGGVFGLEAGLNYFYRDNHYLSVSAGAATDIFAEHIGKGYFESGRTLFAAVRNHFIAGSFDLGYGLSISRMELAYISTGDTINLDKITRNLAAGLSLSASYSIGRYSRIGLLYQPCFLKLSGPAVTRYQHYISVNISWKIPVNRKQD